MKFPIDTEAYISAVNYHGCMDATEEKIYREYLPLFNEAYQVGLEGRPNIFLTYEEEMQEFIAARGYGCSLFFQRFIKRVVAIGAEAYEQGRQGAGREARV